MMAIDCVLTEYEVGFVYGIMSLTKSGCRLRFLSISFIWLYSFTSRVCTPVSSLLATLLATKPAEISNSGFSGNETVFFYTVGDLSYCLCLVPLCSEGLAMEISLLRDVVHFIK